MSRPWRIFQFVYTSSFHESKETDSLCADLVVVVVQAYRLGLTKANIGRENEFSTFLLPVSLSQSIFPHTNDFSKQTCWSGAVIPVAIVSLISARLIQRWAARTILGQNRARCTECRRGIGPIADALLMCGPKVGQTARVYILQNSILVVR